MPIMHRTRHHDGLSVGAADPVPQARLPHRDLAPVPRSRRLVVPRWREWAWPATLIMLTAAVFALSLIVGNLAMALVMAVATIIAGGIIVIMTAGPAEAVRRTWSGRLRDRAVRLRHR